MCGRTTDNKNIELLKLTSHLRDHIDAERIIGLNADALRRSDISAALLGHLQMSENIKGAGVLIPHKSSRKYSQSLAPRIFLPERSVRTEAKGLDSLNIP